MVTKNKLFGKNRAEMKQEIQQHVKEKGAAKFNFRGILLNNDKIIFNVTLKAQNGIHLQVLAVNGDYNHPNILEYQNIISDAYLKQESNKIFKPQSIMTEEEISWTQI